MQNPIYKDHDMLSHFMLNQRLFSLILMGCYTLTIISKINVRPYVDFGPNKFVTSVFIIKNKIGARIYSLIYCK